MEAPHVYTAIANVMADMTKEGITKGSKNTQQGYAFRGIDAVYNALAPKLSTHGLCILPRVVAKEASERESKNGGVLLYTRLTVEFDLVSAKDGSKHTICTVGEAMDSADKSSNKAMSAAYKYAAFMAFCIPTEGDNDADSTTHEVAASFVQPAQKKAAQQAANGNSPKDADEAQQRFYARYAEVIGGQEWSSVQRYLASRAPRPTSIEGWVAVAEAVRDKQKASG
jgi:hypothetical protein